MVDPMAVARCSPRSCACFAFRRVGLVWDAWGILGVGEDDVHILGEVFTWAGLYADSAGG